MVLVSSLHKIGWVPTPTDKELRASIICRSAATRQPLAKRLIGVGEVSSVLRGEACARKALSSKSLVSVGERAKLSPTHSLSQGPCATTVATAWQGKRQKHFLLHKSPAICVGLGVL